MSGSLGLRVVAIAIALAGVADPVVSIERQRRRPLTVAILDAPSLTLPDGDTTRRERAYAIADSLRGALSDVFDVSVREHSLATVAAPCSADAACIVISDGRRPLRMGERNAPLGAVLIGAPIDGNVAITSVRSPARTHPRALGVVTVELSARGITGQTALEVFDDGVLVGQATHDWTADSQASSTAQVRIEWTPVAEGVRDLTITARPVEGERTIDDNTAHVAVDVSEYAATVLVHEPRPSWAGTFVRRAIADDARFRVLARARLGGALSIETAQIPLQLAALVRNGIAVVLVTAPDQLTSSEVDALDQFARVRGGSVIVLVDAPPASHVRRLIPFAVVQHAERNPVAVGRLRASEFVTFDALGLETTVLSAGDEGAVVVSRNVGRGRVVAYGAGDAWRYRDREDQFAHYWRSLMADAEQAAGDPLTLDLSSSVVQPGEQVRLGVEWRSSDVPEPVEVRGGLDCDGRRSMIRLWPSHAPNRFEGSFTAPSSGRCEVHVAIDDRETATAAMIAGAPIAQLNAGRDELSAAITANGGVVVVPDQQSALVTAFRRSASTEHIPAPSHLMRSPWWIIPFAGCLGGEWWWRRRRGQR